MLSQAHRRSIHSSLAPVLGEEETDALMSEFALTDADRPVSQAMFEAAITELRHDMQLGFADQRTVTEKTLRQAAQQMMVIMSGALVGGMAVSTAIATGIAQAIGGGG